MERFTLRDARSEDAPELCDLLNAIIRIGGTTALETPLTPEEFERRFLANSGFLSCIVAEAGDGGAPLGFQALERHSKLPADWGDIATFTRQQPRVRGVGTALFTATRARAQDLGLTKLNATIRADNYGGLAYYSKMGFQDWRVSKAVALKDGTPVDRIWKRREVA